MSFVQIPVRCAKCEWTGLTAFGMSGSTQFAAPIQDCPKCKQPVEYPKTQAQPLLAGMPPPTASESLEKILNEYPWTFNLVWGEDKAKQRVERLKEQLMGWFTTHTTTLRQELAKPCPDCRHWGVLQEAEQEITTLTTQVRRLTEALRKYGQHLPDCHRQKCASIGYHPAHNPGKHECTCALDTAALTEGTDG